MLVGRERALQHIQDAVNTARARGSTALGAEAESGMGKTVLFSTAERQVGGKEDLWIRAKADQLGQRPFAVIADIIEQLVTRQNTSSATLGALLSGSSVSVVGRSLLPALLPDLMPSGETVKQAVELPQQQYEELCVSELSAVISLLIPHERALILCVDDLQWADRLSVQVLALLLKKPPEGLAVIFLSRPGGFPDRIASHVTTFLDLPALSSDDATRLALTGGGRRLSQEHLVLCQGNPMAILAVSSLGGLNDPLGGSISDRFGSSKTERLLMRLAAARLDSLSHGAVRVALVAALLDRPFHHSMLAHVKDAAESSGPDDVHHLMEAGVMVGDEEKGLSFSHDSLQYVASLRAHTRPDILQTAARILKQASDDGDDKAAYTLAGRLLPSIQSSGVSSPNEKRDGPTEPRSEPAIYQRAARYALKLSFPQQALVFAQRAVRQYPTVTPALLLLAHEAAYLLDDGDAMSSLFRRIRGHGDVQLTAQAREHWIRRCYARSQFGGAVRIAETALKELGLMVPAGFRGYGDVLTRKRPKQVLRRLIAAGRATEEKVVTGLHLCSRVFLPQWTSFPDLTVCLAGFMLDLSAASGWTEHSAIAIVAWWMARSVTKLPGRWLVRFRDAALRIAELAADPTVLVTVRSYSAIFVSPWIAPHTDVARELDGVALDAVAIGAPEPAVHCWHIASQSRIYGGHPLRLCIDYATRSRSLIRYYGFFRPETALRKYQQFCLTLSGRGERFLDLDGTLCSDPGYLTWVQSNGDTLSVFGFSLLKGLLAIYANETERALSWLRTAFSQSSAVGALHDRGIISFYYAWTCARLGKAREARDAVRAVRRFARSNPAAYRHRWLAVVGERFAAGGFSSIGRAVVRRAARLAAKAGINHEAGLIYERLSQLCTTAGQTVEAAGARSYACAFYTAWGATGAAARVAPVSHQARTPPVPAGEEHQKDALPELASERTVLERLSHTLLDAGEASSGYLRYNAHDFKASLRFSRQRDRILPTVEVEPADVPLEIEAELERETESGDPYGTSFLRRASGDRYLVARLRPSRGVELIAVLNVHASDAYLRQTVEPSVERAIQNAGIELLRYQIDEDRRVIAVADEEQKRRLMYGALSEGLALVTSQGEVLFSNRAAEQHVQYRPPFRPRIDAAVWRELIDTMTANPEALHWALAPLALEGRMVEVTAVRPTESIHRGPDGPDGMLVALSIRDVTDLIRSERALQESQRRLVIADRLASIGMFSSSIVHEIGNPNHILRLNAQAAERLLDHQEQTSDGARLRELLAQISEASARIESVLRTAKSYARDGREERWTLVDMNEVAERAFRFCRIMASHHSDVYTLATAAGDTVVKGESALLEQALVNLIRNACEATTARDQPVAVTVAANPEENEVSVHVTNGGRPLPDQIRSSVGTAFASVGKGAEGTGLGLSIVKSIVERHDGTLDFPEQYADGTMARIRLPALAGRVES